MSGTGNAIDGTGSNDLFEQGTVTEVSGINGNARSGFSDANYFQNTTAITPINDINGNFTVSMWWSPI